MSDHATTTISARKGKRRRRAETGGPGYDGTRDLRVVAVEDPLEPGGIARPLRNVGHDPIEMLRHKHKVLGDAEYRAAHRIRRLFEALGAAGVRTVNLTAVRVDTSGPTTDIREATLRAAHELALLRAELGRDDFNAVARVAGYGEALTVVAVDFESSVTARANGACDRRTVDAVSRRLRDGLARAAIMWGYADEASKTAMNRRGGAWLARGSRPTVSW